MTPLPKRKLSTQRQGKRRATHIFTAGQVGSCPNCGEPYLPHTVCGACGYYDGKQVLTIKAEKPKEK